MRYSRVGEHVYYSDIQVDGKTVLMVLALDQNTASRISTRAYEYVSRRAKGRKVVKTKIQKIDSRDVIRRLLDRDFKSLLYLLNKGFTTWPFPPPWGSRINPEPYEYNTDEGDDVGVNPIGYNVFGV